MTPDPQNLKKEWYSPADLSEEVQIPIQTLYAWRYTGHGPVAHRLGKHLRYSRADVAAWLLAQRDERNR